MSWWSSILCALLSAVLGGACSAVASVLATRWLGVSTREGKRAYLVVALVLMGIVAGGIVGLATARTLADRADAGFATAFGWSAAVLVGVAAAALAMSWMGRVEPPRSASPGPHPEVDVSLSPAARRPAEVCAFTADTPLQACLDYSRRHDDEAGQLARRAIAERPNLTAELRELLAGDDCMQALHYLAEPEAAPSADLLPGVHAALQRIPDMLRRVFRDPGGVHADSGLHQVRLALAVIARFGPQRQAFRPEVEALAETFAEAPRVRRFSRGSRYVEEKIKVFDAERLLAAWLK